MTIPRPIPESYWVKPGQFLAGEYPGSYEERVERLRLSAFLEAGFTDFIDLTQPGELIPYGSMLEELAKAYGVQVFHERISVMDRGLPTAATMGRIIERIDSALEQGRKVYLHCWGGVGRTGTAVGCYLVQHGLSGEQALRQISDWWQSVPKRIFHPYSPETREQFDFIRNWYILSRDDL